MHEPYILHIDTATEVCSVSLSRGHTVLDTIETHEPNQHASQLTVFVERVLATTDVQKKELNAVAVSMGPGSYTGLRIGVSTAKGLCYGLDIPLIGISTLASMFEGYKSAFPLSEDALYCPMIDARRMEVYTAVWNAQSENVSPVAAKIIDHDSFDPYGSRPIYLFGSGASKFDTLFGEHPHIRIEKDFRHSSRSMCALALQRYQAQEFEDLIYFEPFYLKEFIATTPRKK